MNIQPITLALIWSVLISSVGVFGLGRNPQWPILIGTIQDVNSAEAEVTKLVSTASLIAIAPYTDRFKASWDLGDVRPGQEFAVTLKLFNPTDKEFVFDRVVAGCACAKLRVRHGVILAGETGEIEVEFRSPESNADGKVEVAIGFSNKNPEIVNCYGTFTANLLDNLHFDPGVHTFKAGEDLSVFRVPFSASRSIDLAKLEITKSKSVG